MNSDLRSPLSRARGLGSAKSGVHHWWVQRLTAVALIPLVDLVRGLAGDAERRRLRHGARLARLAVRHGAADPDDLHRPASRPARHPGRDRGLRAQRRRQAGADRGGQVHRGVLRAGGDRGHPCVSDSEAKSWPRRAAARATAPVAGTVNIGSTAYKVDRSRVRRGRRRRRRRRPARDLRHGQEGLQDRLHHQGVPDPQPHRGGAGRHLGRAGQHGPGRLALAHVRHRQGLRLARRPGRDRIHGAATASPRSSSSSITACRSAARPRARSTSARSAA